MYKMKYLIILAGVMWALFFYTNAKALSPPEITNKEFAYEIKSCVDKLYTDEEKYPLSKQVPLELIIAQAAHESAWGKSRFAVEGNNLFGIRTWDETVPQMKAKGAPNAKWGLRTYKSWCDSITHYLHILNTYPAYEPFRNELEFQIGSEKLAISLTLYLEPWSEQGKEYVRLLQSVILGLYKKEFFNQLIQRSII